MSRRRKGGGRAHGSTAHRVGEELRMKLSELLLREVHDPDVRGVHVTRVEMRSDLSGATVAYRTTPGAADPEEAAAALTRVAPFLRGEIGRSMRLKRAPELRFELDRLPDEGDRIEALLAVARGGGSARLEDLGPPADDGPRDDSRTDDGPADDSDPDDSEQDDGPPEHSRTDDETP